MLEQFLFVTGFKNPCETCSTRKDWFNYFGQAGHWWGQQPNSTNDCVTSRLASGERQ